MNSAEQTAAPSTRREYNIALIGKPSVGKTALTLQIVEKQFYDSINHTDGVFKVKKELISYGFTFLVNIHDIEGFDFPNENLANMISNCDAICIVFDSTNYVCNDELQVWIDYVKGVIQSKPNTLLFVVLTHLDLIDVSKGSEIQELLDPLHLQYFFVNNKDYFSVQHLFYSIIECLCKEYKAISSSQSIRNFKQNTKSVQFILDEKKELKKITPQQLELIQEKEINKQKRKETRCQQFMRFLFPCCCKAKKLT